VGQPFVEFTSDSFGFFRELAQNNNKAWFDQNRERYDRHVVGAFRGLLEALQPFLLKLNPHFETGGKTGRNFSRINRDIRFSKDKSPYKPNYYLYIFNRSREPQSDGRLYVGLSAECITVGFACYASWKRGKKSALETIFRKRLQSHSQRLKELLHGVVRKGRYQTYWHREEGKDWVRHPGLPRSKNDWSTLQAWIVRKVFSPRARGLASAEFASQVEQIFAQLYPLYAFSSSASPRWQRDLEKAASGQSRSAA
jgi:uncharacterized protein (TIGR02453 family)